MKKILFLITTFCIISLSAMDAPQLSEETIQWIHEKIRAVNRHMCTDEMHIDFSKINDVDPQDGTTPIMKQLAKFYPYYSGDPLVIAYLISKGARADVKDAQGNGTIVYAMRGGNFDAISLLKEHKAEIPVCNKSSENMPPLIECLSKLYDRLWVEEDRPLVTDIERMKAIYKAATDFVSDLIKAGNHPDQRRPGMKTALIIAAEFSFADIVKRLLDAKADTTLKFQDKTAADYIPQYPKFFVGNIQKCREYLEKK